MTPEHTGFSMLQHARSYNTVAASRHSQASADDTVTVQVHPLLTNTPAMRDWSHYDTRYEHWISVLFTTTVDTHDRWTDLTGGLNRDLAATGDFPPLAAVGDTPPPTVGPAVDALPLPFRIPPKLCGSAVGMGAPFLVTHTMMCMATANSALLSLASLSASAAVCVCYNSSNDSSSNSSKQ
eukprot:14469-Heterococcus_DN1.PRE.2